MSDWDYEDAAAEAAHHRACVQRSLGRAYFNSASIEPPEFDDEDDEDDEDDTEEGDDE